ncbi:MAG: hypothetical protein CL920_29140 [Deltaproteobacteria bacterium]|nr:hypothetical protein [Deltaproteobacteria bacterium]
MLIWVDADACPKAVKEVLFRASERRKLHICLVANRSMYIPRSSYVSLQVVPKGFDVADEKIIEQVEKNDLIITADIPFAAEAIERGAWILTPRGEQYTEDDIRERLSMRNFFEEMRNNGEMTGGPPPFGKADKQRFANGLDRILAQLKNA